MVNYYEILGVSMSATLQEIKVAYKKMAIIFHPDKNPNNKNADEKFKLINEAYQTLSKPQKASVYRQKLDYHLFQQKNQAKPNSRNYETFQTQRATSGLPEIDFSNLGKYYYEPITTPRKKNFFNHYFLGICLFVIIGSVCLLLGIFMNKFAAQNCYEKAQFCYQNNDYIPALQQLNQALEFDNRFAEAYLLRGEIYFTLHKFESALPNFNYAIQYSKVTSKNIVLKRELCKKLIGDAN
jgi:curved DNA-binding protein CbpA